MIFVSSVSTILFNANPLLRYDGYYILSDLIEIPNLRQKATTILQRTLGNWFLGIESKVDPFLPAKRKGLFIFYSLVAVAYRWLITLSIFWFLYRLLEPYGMKIIGQLIAMVAIWGLLGMPLVQLYKFFSVPGRIGTVKRGRALISLAVVAAVIGGILFVPIPHHVDCSFFVQPQNVANVYVDMPGVLNRIHVQPMQEVTAGQPLADLSNFELELQLEKLAGQSEINRKKYESAVQSSEYESGLVNDVDAAFAEWQSAYADYRQREKDTEMLTIKAPVTGTLVAAPRVENRKTDSGALARWFGTPLEHRNIGAVLDQSTLVGRIIPDHRKMEAVLAIDQSEIEFIQRNQPVKLWVYQLPGTIFESTTSTSISPTKMKSVPKALSSRFGGDLVSTLNELGTDVPQSTTYLVNVSIDSQNCLIVDGATGRAKIRVGSQTIAQRFWRAACRTFRFEL